MDMYQDRCLKKLIDAAKSATDLIECSAFHTALNSVTSINEFVDTLDNFAFELIDVVQIAILALEDYELLDSGCWGNVR